MERITHANGVITYTFKNFDPNSVHVHITTRHGGVSPPPWNSLNFSVSRGDTPERVQQNRERVAEALDIDTAKIIRTHQVHGTRIAKVGGEDAGSWQEGTDGLITSENGLPLGLVFADCVPVVFYDPEHHVLGACHAGWRGTVNGMAVATLWAMQASYDTKPDQVYAAELFTYPNGPDEQPYFDLWQANELQLTQAGVMKQNIEVSGIDTAQNVADFFSHRAEQGKCGLFSMVAWLEQK